MQEGLFHYLYDLMIAQGMNDYWAKILNVFILFIAALIIAGLLDLLVWRLLRFLTVRIARHSRTNFDDFLVSNRVPRKVAHLVPLVFMLEITRQIFTDYPYTGSIVLKFFQILAVILILSIVKGVLASVRDYLKTLPRFRDKPIDSYIQVFMIFAWGAGILTVFAIMTGSSMVSFLTGLGAASAVILLIFKDTILGLVASIQVSANDMVRIGDWITFEKYGADGDVTEINLATVKVQNFDKTITTIPTYALISDSFQNWRGMTESGGRRIKRSLIVRQQGIKYLSAEDLDALKGIQLIRDYVLSRQEKIEQYNQESGADKSLPINGRNLTNLGVFRKYVETYLENHSAINKNMTLMTRQLAPTSQGIPIEIYAFSSDKRWENYEYIMADIFDHLLAATSYFGLEIYELPASLQPNPGKN